MPEVETDRLISYPIVCEEYTRATGSFHSATVTTRPVTACPPIVGCETSDSKMIGHIHLYDSQELPTETNYREVVL